MTKPLEDRSPTAEELNGEIAKALTFTTIARANRNDHHRRERMRLMAQQVHDLVQARLPSASLSADELAEIENRLAKLRTAINAVPHH